MDGVESLPHETSVQCLAAERVRFHARESMISNGSRIAILTSRSINERVVGELKRKCLCGVLKYVLDPTSNTV